MVYFMRLNILPAYMRTLFILLFTAFGFSVFAQDDIPDFRTKRENFKKLLDKDIRNDLARFTLGGLDESLGKDPLKDMPIKSCEKNSIVFANDTMQVVIKSEAFEPAKHKMQYYEKYVIKIDNKPYYGSFGKPPKQSIASVLIITGRDTIMLSAGVLNDLYDPSFCYTDAQTRKIKSHCGVYFSADMKRIYIYMLNNESAGGYEVTWILQDKKYAKRVLDYEFN